MDSTDKLRPLFLAKILYERTDEDTTLSTSELIDILQTEYGIKTYRTTIASDVKLLKKFGLEIESYKSQSIVYNLINRKFDIPEIKLLIDAVSSSKFITEKKSAQLVEKLQTLASQNQAEALKRNLVVQGRIKPNNEQIYYIVDAVNTAINEKKKIAFRYFTYDAKKKKQLRNNGEDYIFSPYHFIWNGDYYYMVGFSDKHGDIGSFRLDRIVTTPVILAEKAIPIPKDFRINKFLNVNFRMYNTPASEVELICDNSVMDALIDKFGHSIKTFPYDENNFISIVEVAVNHVFFSWVFGFGGKVRINGPDNIKEKYIDMVKSVLEASV